MSMAWICNLSTLLNNPSKPYSCSNVPIMTTEEIELIDMAMDARGTRITHQCVEISTPSLSMLVLTVVPVEVALVRLQYAKILRDLIHLVTIAHGTPPILTHVVILTMSSSLLLSTVVFVDQLKLVLLSSPSHMLAI